MRYYILHAGTMPKAGTWSSSKSEARAHFKIAFAIKGRLPIGWKVT